MAIHGGYLLPGAALLQGDDTGFFETYKGVVETETGKAAAYVKLLPKKALANELVCTVLGQAAGLPVPDGYLVQVSVDDYPDSLFLCSQKLTHTLAYGSVDLDSPSLARKFGADNVAFDTLISDWPRWNEALLFDEWVSNGDRHPGNFLVRSPNDVWLIDHSHAFRGPNWYLMDLVPHSPTRNLIAEHAERVLKLPERKQLLDYADQLTAEYESLALSHIMDESRAAYLLSEPDLSAMQNFLARRLKLLPGFIARRVGIPRFPTMAGA
jgi:hypothetical protein